MNGAKITPEQMARYKERIRRANDPAVIAARQAAIQATANEDCAAIGAALQAAAECDGRCNGGKTNE